MLAAMPSTTIVVACVVGLALLLFVFVRFLVARSRAKAAEPETPRFEPPREIVSRPPTEQKLPLEAANAPAKDQNPFSSMSWSDAAVRPPSLPPVPADPAPPEPPPQDFAAITTPPAEETPLQDVATDPAPSVSRESEETDPPTETRPAQRESKAGAPRPPMPSYSNINDESVAEELLQQVTPAVPASESFPSSKPSFSEPSSSESKPPIAEPPPSAEPDLPISEPKVAAPKLEPRGSAVRAEALPVRSEPKISATPGKRLTPLQPIAAVKPPTPVKPADHGTAHENPAARAVATTVAKFAPPSNPATADLEKNDPRHAAARRLARVSVSEIKLYHEEEVRAGREAKDLWKRLQQDIALARQTFETRIASDVRERFDYLLDEIVRQLAEGDVSKLGPDAPTAKTAEAAKTETVTAPPPGPPAAEAIIDPEAPTRTVRRTLEPLEPEPRGAAVEGKPVDAPPSTKVDASSTTKTASAAASASKPTGLAARSLPSNPETAELEKNDPRHAAARRLARLSVSEIKLYHEDEVKAGREAKDLWKRMITDIGLATQTYEKRVDKEVRDRFDYLYDEILRQLAEGDVSKLGPDAPKPRKGADSSPAQTADAEGSRAAATTPEVRAVRAPVALPGSSPEPKAMPAPLAAAPVSTPASPEPRPDPAPAPAPVAVTSRAAASVVSRYAPAPNPATAELEKSDPRHAAARRLARLSVSEIKLYHEDEVKAGREAKDLWKRLTADIGLATQTFEKRVDKEVRERFDYLYDEILRQLAEGDASKLGPDAPKPKAIGSLN